MESGGVDQLVSNDSNNTSTSETSISVSQVEPVKQKTEPVQVTAHGDIEIPVTSIRRAIANNMVRSKTEIPHAWMMMEVDVTNLVNYRESIKTEFKEKEGFNLTYFAFFIKAVAIALKEYPIMNSVWAGDKIIQKKAINVSIAVATEDSLFVPVIKNADDKSIKGIAKEINELSKIVRAGKLRSEHIEGGTFTVNNTGSFGSVQSMGIINYPQAAILQVESIVKKPVILNGGMFAARDMVNLCLSIDHRVLDGLVAGRFLNRVKSILESTDASNMSIY
ncbi:dihydrolipoamide acetyltransferase family protein [Ureibacillus acetophenoni]|uniref:dihydrolipoamide acetyltransferase family protein n=1 Tax=Ureibacillus acetophenoni TaxID=614649 RepID=UPI0038B605B0